MVKRGVVNASPTDPPVTRAEARTPFGSQRRAAPTNRVRRRHPRISDCPRSITHRASGETMSPPPFRSPTHSRPGIRLNHRALTHQRTGRPAQRRRVTKLSHTTKGPVFKQSSALPDNLFTSRLTVFTCQSKHATPRNRANVTTGAFSHGCCRPDRRPRTSAQQRGTSPPPLYFDPRPAGAATPKRGLTDPSI
jgi:hypothetical protein